MARPAKLTGDDYIKAVTWKHEGWSGERISRALRGIVSANYINTLYREAKKEHDMSEIFKEVSHG
jgi:hypothetical protein